MSQRFEMRLPDELVERVDADRGGQSRAAWLKEAAEMRLAAPRKASSSPPAGRVSRPSSVERSAAAPRTSGPPSIAATWRR